MIENLRNMTPYADGEDQRRTDLEEPFAHLGLGAVTYDHRSERTHSRVFILVRST